MSQSGVMLAEIEARNKITDAEYMKAHYERLVQEHEKYMLLGLISKATTQAKAAPAAKCFNSKLLLTRSI